MFGLIKKTLGAGLALGLTAGMANCRISGKADHDGDPTWRWRQPRPERAGDHLDHSRVSQSGDDRASDTGCRRPEGHAGSRERRGRRLHASVHAQLHRHAATARRNRCPTIQWRISFRSRGSTMRRSPSLCVATAPIMTMEELVAASKARSGRHSDGAFGQLGRGVRASSTNDEGAGYLVEPGSLPGWRTRYAGAFGGRCRRDHGFPVNAVSAA